MVILQQPTANFVEGTTYPKKKCLQKSFDNDFKIAHDSANELLADIEHNHIVIRYCSNRNVFPTGKTKSHEVQKDVGSIKK